MQCVKGGGVISVSLFLINLDFPQRGDTETKQLSIRLSDKARGSSCLSVRVFACAGRTLFSLTDFNKAKQARTKVQFKSLVLFLCHLSSVPGLRPLVDVNYLPLTDMRIARTFCFTNLGQAMYLCSPTEIQRITYSQDTCENLQVC